MSKKQESSVNLNLGIASQEDEMDEAEFEEEEDEEIEEDSDEEIVDYGDADEKPEDEQNKNINVNHTEDLNPISEGSKSNLVNVSNFNEEEHNEEHSQINMQEAQRKVVAQSVPNKVTFNGVTTENKNKKSNTEKTVFTRISEDIYNKFVSDKSQHYKKTSAYDFMINDLFLNRIVEKSDKDSQLKFQDFFARNKEFRDKKQLNLQERTEKLTQEMKIVCNGTPNGRVLDPSEIRAPSDYFNDQLTFFETRDLNVKQQQEEIKKLTETKIRETPEISEKSKKLAEKRLKDDPQEVHFRLFKGKLQKEKKNFLSTEVKPSTAPKRSKEEINEIVNKLHQEGEVRRQNKEKLVKEKFGEFHHMYNSDDELTGKNSTLQILAKFLENFFNTLEKTYGAREAPVDYEGFTNLLVELGFSRYINNNQKLKNWEVLCANEKQTVDQAWSLILSNCQVEDKEGDKVDSNFILVFLCIVLGLYKGQNEEEAMEEIKAFEAVDEADKENGEQDNKDEECNLSCSNKIESTPEKQKDSLSVNDKNPTPLKHSENDSEIISVDKKSSPKKNTIILLKTALPELDLNKYKFSTKSAKNIKHLFRHFYSNRMDFLYESKKAVRKERLLTRESLLSGYKTENLWNDLSHSIKKKKVKIDPNSRLIREKRVETGLAKLKKEIEEKEIAECTFQPNIHKPVIKKAVKETVENLYQDGVFKMKQKKEETKVETEENMFTFAPHVNPFRSEVFKENHQINKDLVEREVKRIEKARLERKILEAQKKKGIYNLKGLKNVDALIDEEEHPAWNYSLEKRFHKDTLENFSKTQSSKSDSRSDFFRTFRHTKTSLREPLLNIEVNIDDKNGIEKLEIYADDDPMLVAKDFCERYGLGEDKKMRLQKIIEDKLSENFGKVEV